MEQQIILSGMSVGQLRELIVEIFKEREEFRQTLEKKKATESIYLSRKDVARMLRISLPTLHEYVKHNLIIAHRIGRRVLFKSEEVERALKAISYRRK